MLSASGAGADILVAGGGAETVNAARASGNLVIFGGPGNDVLTGGTGNDLFVAEPGNETLTGGGGTNSYVLIDFGATARSDVITDFNPNTDAIGLFGYGPEPVADATAPRLGDRDGRQDCHHAERRHLHPTCRRARAACLQLLLIDPAMQNYNVLRRFTPRFLEAFRFQSSTLNDPVLAASVDRRILGAGAGGGWHGRDRDRWTPGDRARQRPDR